jgi:hypothetical protein
MLNTACHWPHQSFQSSQALSTQFSILRLSSLLYLRLLSGLLPSDFQSKILYTFFISTTDATWPSHFIALDLILKVKLSHYCHSGTKGRVYITFFSRWGVSGQHRTLATLYSGKGSPSNHCVGGWVGLKAGLDTEARGKILCLC